MELLQKIRSKIGGVILDRRASSVRRLKQNFDFDRVKRIGIVWDATKVDDFIHVAALHRKMTDMGKTVEVLAWIPDNNVPDRLTGLSYMRFLRKSDLTWLLIPKSEDSRQFMETKFDLLIGINPLHIFPLTYLISLSPSMVKAGPDVYKNTENEPYDLMIQSGSRFNTAVFLEQLLHYLAMINNPENRA
jgi:hypothetical protein